MLLDPVLLFFCWEKNIIIYCISHTILSPGPPFIHVQTYLLYTKRQLRGKKERWTPDVGVEPTALRLKV